MARARPDVVHTWLDDSLRMAATPAAHLAIPVVHRIYNVPSVQHLYYPSASGRRDAIGSALHAAAHVVALSAAGGR